MATDNDDGTGHANGNGLIANSNGHTTNGDSRAPTSSHTGRTFKVDSPNVVYTDNVIKSKYTYRTTSVAQDSNGGLVATPKETVYDFKVQRRVGRVGMMLVGWGGNN
ncbi:hypothetical protein LTR04_003335, partial [Oleoguttula sp. CCFEE 6159]